MDLLYGAILDDPQRQNPRGEHGGEKMAWVSYRRFPDINRHVLTELLPNRSFISLVPRKSALEPLYPHAVRGILLTRYEHELLHVCGGSVLHEYYISGRYFFSRI